MVIGISPAYHKISNMEKFNIFILFILDINKKLIDWSKSQNNFKLAVL